MNARLDVAKVRARFPGLHREVAGTPAAFLDGPAGSQVPREVAEAVAGYLLEQNANRGGAFATSVETDAMVDEACRALADFFGTGDPREIVFGANMTTMVFALSRSLAKTWQRGDEVVVTDADHDANVTPWVLAAEDAGATVRRVGVTAEGVVDLQDLDAKLGPRTRLVACGAASNLLGTVQPVAEITARARPHGALICVDAVHSAPHRLPDVAGWGCDFALCSSYKFFGPHTGVLWGKRALLEELPAYKVRPADDATPDRWMTGTPNLEGIAGAKAAVEYLVSLAGGATGGRRAALVAAYRRIEEHENALLVRLMEGLGKLPVRVIGIGAADPRRRVPTVALVAQGHSPQELHAALAERGIFTWAGHSYALPLSTALGLEPEGALRVGLLHYNREDEVDRLLAALGEILG